jgi:PKHD-type hydroxylase
MIQVINNPHDNLSPDQIRSFSKYYTVEEALTSDECDALVEEFRWQVFPAIKKHNLPTSMLLEHCFLSKEHWLHDKIGHVWDLAIEHFNFDVSFVEPYKIQTYANGGYFQRHIDNYHGLNLPVDRKLSMTIQLTNNTAYEGGDLVIGSHVASRKKGTLTVFPSFYSHHVTPVTTGQRWCVIAWAWGPYWR